MVPLCLLALAAAFGQQKEVPAPTIKRHAELVLVPAVVTQDGKPVRGLTAKDFNLLHDGQPELVEVFEEIDATPASVEPVPLPPRTVQNFVLADSRQDILILFLDYLNATWSSRARIQSFLADVTRQFSETHTSVSVFLLTRDRLIQLHSFTSDLGNLTKAIERWQSGLPASGERYANWASPFDRMGNVQTDAAIRAFDVPYGIPSLTAAEAAEMTADAMQQVGEAYRGFPGRKKLIWMSTGFPLPSGGALVQMSSSGITMAAKIAEQQKRAWEALSRANITVYPIDSNGVVNPDWEEKFSPQQSGIPIFVQPVTLEFPSNTPSLLALAEKTGGLVCTDFPSKCLGQALHDGTHYYMLGFYLRGNNKPGWHELKVNVKQAGADVRSRTGFAISEPHDKIPKKGKEEVDTALASPLDYTSIPLRLSWAVLPTQGKEVQFELALLSPPGGIALNPEDSRINLDYLAFVRPVGKTEGKTFPVTLTTWVSPDQQKTLATAGFRFRKTLALAPGRYEVRVLVRDNVARKMGTVSTIIDLTASPAPVSGTIRP